MAKMVGIKGKCWTGHQIWTFGQSWQKNAKKKKKKKKKIKNFFLLNYKNLSTINCSWMCFQSTSGEDSEVKTLPQ